MSLIIFSGGDSKRDSDGGGNNGIFTFHTSLAGDWFSPYH